MEQKTFKPGYVFFVCTEFLNSFAIILMIIDVCQWTFFHISYVIPKLLKLRIFSDQDGKMNQSVSDCGGDILLVSQFTLYGDCKKGNRPSFMQAMPPKDAKALYAHFEGMLKQSYERVSCALGKPPRKENRPLARPANRLQFCHGKR